MGILETLVKKNILNEDDAARIKGSVREKGVPLENLLREKGVKPEDILSAKSESLDIPMRSLEGVDISFETLKYIPEESSVHYRFLPIAVKDGVLEVGIVDPDNLEARDALNFISSKIRMPFKLFLISVDDFEKAKGLYTGLTGEVTRALSDLETELSVETENIVDTKSDVGYDTRIIEDAPVTKVVATIVHYAVEGNASDIHIEPEANLVRVRFRVDGLLVTSLTLPLKAHSAVVARIKILSNMRLDEKRKPQDGRFSAKVAGRKVDFRVSTFPTYFGEKVALRILDTEKGVKAIDNLGLSKRDLELVKKALNAPYGMILISGPTGSGKSTTLYSMLNELDREIYNVLSLEDPVEYNIPGMNQSQVKPEIGYTFANGLRSTLRQDPDIIMVGEIRDKETAALAVQAALTGHLVLSTIHTNSAAGVIPRLVDMGIDPYLIAPTLILAMAQRLVKTLCPGGGKAMPVADSIKLILEKQFADIPEKYRHLVPKGKELYSAEPTAECPTGTRGRQAVFEVLEMNNDLERVILKDPTENSIMKVAREEGMFTMKEDAIFKAFNKEIPFGEINKL